MSDFFQELAIAMTAGLLRGSVYALVALGIVLVYRASGIFNFAQAEFGTTGLFAAYAALELWGWSYPLAFAFGMGAAITMGLLTERLVIHPLRNSSKVTLLVGTAGVALAAIGLQFWLFNETLIMTMPRISEKYFVTPWGAQVTSQALIAAGVLVVVAIALAMFFRSPSGLAIQAAQQEPVAAELVGISVRRVSMMTWGIAAALGGLAGILTGPILSFTAAFLSFGAFAALLPGFMAAVLAGMRSMPGAVAGGLLVGFIEQLGSLSLLSDTVPGAGAAMLFVFLLAALLIRPQGILTRGAAVAA
ncbi:branched-chain amino acid ABC transporter permease [Nocardioides sp.]|uniref:branched-chain amino acid ABC transporter permease n=1 Tax=Nocardioides sp. TaxID=35761 RepID=UPI0035694458